MRTSTISRHFPSLAFSPDGRVYAVPDDASPAERLAFLAGVEMGRREERAARTQMLRKLADMMPKSMLQGMAFGFCMFVWMMLGLLIYVELPQ